MVRLSDLAPDEAKFLREWECPVFEHTPFVTGPPLSQRRVAAFSTAGLRRLSDRPYATDSVDYRVLPLEHRSELVQDHVSSSFDRTGFAQDLNTVLPLDRLLELADEGVIGSVSDFHYSFMGASGPLPWEPFVRKLAKTLHDDGVNAALLAPV